MVKRPRQLHVRWSTDVVKGLIPVTDFISVVVIGQMRDMSPTSQVIPKQH